MQHWRDIVLIAMQIVLLFSMTMLVNADPSVASKQDSDNDGITDLEEAKIYRTDSQLSDTDTDGLSDGDEINIYFSNPLQKDTDADGFLDGIEAKHQSDPLDPDSIPAKSILDLDGDGLSNREEINSLHTDPQLVDSDFDGLTDDVEVNEQFTNPLAVDTDGDKFWDGEEIAAGTDPGDAESHP